MSNYDVILSPVITEKSTRRSEANQVIFKVAAHATKPQIKEAVEKLFEVKVKAVNTINTRKGKFKAFRGRPACSGRQESRRDLVEGPPDRRDDGPVRTSRWH